MLVMPRPCAFQRFLRAKCRRGRRHQCVGECTRTAGCKSPSGRQFLGFRFDQGRKWPRDKSKARLRDTIRQRPPRTSGTSLEAIIKGLNPVLRGWFGYFKHAHKGAMREVDGWVRRRLRAILRKRQKRQGAGRGWDHQRWPNLYFAGAGLFSVEQAHRAACQSMKMAH